MKRSRRYREIKDKISDNKHYSLSDAIDFLKNNKKEKLNSIKASFALNWTNQKNVLKSKITLPYPVVKEDKIVVISEELPENLLESCQKVKKIELLTVAEVQQKVTKKKKKQWGFAKLLAHPNSETKLKPLEKILGPKAMYPTKKNGALTENILEEVEKFQKGEKIIKTDKGGNIHAVLGKTDFNSEQLTENYKTLFNEIVSLRPVGWKGDFLRSATLSTTMGPGLKILK